jgi:phosphate transport system substrate-binding protein
MHNLTKVIALCAAPLFAVGCGKKTDQAAGVSETAGAAGETAAPSAPATTIRIDGSSTVFPITQAVAEEFQAKQGGRVTIGVSGTGGGFKKFCRKETDITGASRPIKDSEKKLCADNGIEYIELPIAYDGLAVVVHKDNTWVDSMTIAELKKMWSPEAQGTVTKWNQVNPAWPDRDLHLFGAGVDSGTYDYFTAAVVGTEHASRGDFTSSEDDNVLVQGIATDPNALGFFGYAYYADNADELKLIAIDDGDASNGTAPILPSVETVANGTYQPLSRPIFIYVSRASVENESVKKFIDFYLTQGEPLVKEVGYIPLPNAAYELVEKRFQNRTTGSVFEGGSKVGATVEELLRGS